MESWFLGVVHTSCWSLSWDREDASRRKVRSKVHDAIMEALIRWLCLRWILVDRSSVFGRILARKNY